MNAFNVGDIVEFIRGNQDGVFSAHKGALAEVRGYKNGYLQVHWLTESYGQCDGGYSEPLFRKTERDICPTCKQVTPQKPITIQGYEAVIGANSIQIGCTKVERSTITEILHRMDAVKGA